MKDIKKYMQELEEKIRYHQYLYYVKNTPEISDFEFDKLFSELIELEKRYPEYASINSPTKVVGSDLSNEFEKFTHKIPVLSLENTYSTPETLEWAKKIGLNQKFSVEWKIDGASLVLYYEKGDLIKGVSRGTGGVGDDITENVRTIRGLPLVLSKKITLSVRGEVYMTFADFEEFNSEYGGRFANPRNLASGSLKQKQSSQVARRPLRLFCYDAYVEDKEFQVNTYEEIINLLKELRFPVSEDIEFVNGKNLENTIEKFRNKKDHLSFPTDGLVIKLNDLKLREELGATSHSPRWARALKFEALMKESKIIDIQVTTGRTGKVTPRAEIEPIQLAGTIVRYATLHNQDYINELGIGIGAIVKVAKRGEIIPAVEEVISPPQMIYKIPENCISCGTKLVRQEEFVDYFCPNENCPARILARLIFFCQKKQMDIEGLGEKQIQTFYNLGYIKNIPDIYKLYQHKEEIQKLEGFGEKSVQIILNGIEKSKSKSLKTLLPSLGFPEIGHKVTEILIDNGYDSIEKIIELVQSPNAKELLLSIYGLGEKTVSSIIQTFKEEKNLNLIQELQELGLNFTYQTSNVNLPKIFEGETWCVTGSFVNFQPRDKAMDLVVLFGGKKVSSVSKNTTHLLLGEGAGSKLEKAKQLGVIIVNEQEFVSRLPENFKEYL